MKTPIKKKSIFKRLGSSSTNLPRSNTVTNRDSCDNQQENIRRDIKHQHYAVEFKVTSQNIRASIRNEQTSDIDVVMSTHPWKNGVPAMRHRTRCFGEEIPEPTTSENKEKKRL